VSDEQGPFWKLVWAHGVWALTGSVLAVILAVLSIFGITLPVWVAWLLLVAGVVTSVYLAGLDTHNKRLALADKLNPKLEILGITQRNEANNHWRIKIHNPCAVSMRFSVQLESISPPPRGQGDHLAIPAFLQLTYTIPPHKESEIPAGGHHLVDVFVDTPHGAADKIGMLTVGHIDGHPPPMPRVRYEIVVCAFPLSAFGGAATRRSFFIIPQQDGGMVFSDADNEAKGDVAELSSSNNPLEQTGHANDGSPSSTALPA
jgi:hypothetical protein